MHQSFEYFILSSTATWFLQLNVIEETEEESRLMMVVSVELLLQGKNDSYDDRMWYLDTGANSHLTGKLAFFHKIDEN